jgi:hypothetical protein
MPMKTLINQTQAIDQMEISQVLEEYPYHPYQYIFSNSDRHQHMLAALNHVNGEISRLKLLLDSLREEINALNSAN